MGSIRHSSGVVILAILLTADDARAVDVRFLFDDPAGTGFFDPVLGPARQQAIQAAADVWGKLIRPSYVGEEILVRAKFDSLPATQLAVAKASHLYSDFGSSSPQYLTETNYPKALANHLAGRDLAPERHDIEIRFSAAASFYFGLDGLPPAGQVDFVTTAAHELGHGMGFYDSFRDDGDFGLRGDFSYDDITCNECLPTPYDTFLTLGPMGPTLTSLSSSNRESAVTSNNVYWNGAGGLAGGGSAPRVSAPTTFNDQSSISHLDQSLGTLMVPNYPGVIQSLSPVERGMLRDMGWTISVANSTVNWTGLGANNRSSTASNWTPALPLPGDSLGFGAAPQTDVLLDLVLPTLADITFAADAPSYALRFERQRVTDLTGAGVVNNSSQPQNILLENGFALSPDQRAATINFRGSATAGNADYELRGGGTSYESPPNLPPRYMWGQGASLTFDGTANAGNATFTVDGGTGFTAPQATVVFRGSARADRAEFDNIGGHAGFMLPGPPASAAGYGGETRFEGNSWAENARFRNHGQTEHSQGAGGFTTFYDNATAGDATFENFAANVMFGGGYGGATLFYENSTAATGDFTNHGARSSFPAFGMGRTEFFDDSRAGPDSDFTNLGGEGESRPGGVTRFHDRSTAQGATFINRRSTNPFGGLPGTTEFYDDATAPNAQFELEGGKVGFYDRTTAGNSTFHFVGAADFPQMVRDSGVDFRGNSRAGEADFNLDSFSGATITFWDHSTADQANFVLPHDGYGTLYFAGDSSASDREYQLGRNNIMNFLHRATAADANITVHPRAGLGFGQQELLTDVATAGNATIRVLGGNMIHPAGQLTFRGASSAGDATIRAEGATEGSPFSGANVIFHSNAHAGAATLIAAGGAAGAAGGKILFYSGSAGDVASLVTEPGGLIDFADSLTFTSGSISGGGMFALRSAVLTTGSLNFDTTVTGQIVANQLLGAPGGLTKVGTGTLTLAGTNTYTGLTTVTEGTLRVTGSIAGDALVQAGATLAGSGNVAGDVDLEPGAIVTPGASPGVLTVGGDFNQPAGGILRMEIAGTTPGTHYDVLNVGGDLTLDGQLVVQFIEGFAPLAGQQFNLIDVGGASLSLPDIVVENLAPGFQFDSAFVDGLIRFTALNDGVFVSPGVPGDTNNDGVVDIVDLNNVRNNFGAMGTPILGDTNGDDVVDIVDLNAVRNNFGASAESPAVPEPSTAVLAACGLVAVMFLQHRRGSNR